MCPSWNCARAFRLSWVLIFSLLLLPPMRCNRRPKNKERHILRHYILRHRCTIPFSGFHVFCVLPPSLARSPSWSYGHGARRFPIREGKQERQPLMPSLQRPRKQLSVRFLWRTIKNLLCGKVAISLPFHLPGASPENIRSIGLHTNRRIYGITYRKTVLNVI